MIAADANRSNTVTTFDIVEIRKLILGIYTDYLPNQDQPWRFIPEFIPQNDAAHFNVNPFNMPNGDGAAYLEQGWQFSIPGNGQRGFDGIKIGDVNSSWLTAPPCVNLAEGPPVGDSHTPSFTVPTTGLAQGQIVKLVVKAQNFSQVKAFQLGLKLPNDHFELLDIIDVSLPAYTKEDQFGLMQLEENEVKTLWFNETGASTTLTNNSTLFSLVIKAKQPVANLQTLLTLDNDILPNLFIQDGLSPAGLSVSVESAPTYHSDQLPVITETTSSILTCEPNPFTDVLNISFNHHGSETSAELQISNVLGNTIFQKNLLLQKGVNNLIINTLEEYPTGIYWLTFLVEGKVYTRKIVKKQAVNH